jgi:hypothetical protein
MGTPLPLTAMMMVQGVRNLLLLPLLLLILAASFSSLDDRKMLTLQNRL